MVFVPGDYQGLVVAEITKLDAVMLCDIIHTHLPRTCRWIEGFPSWLL